MSAFPAASAADTIPHWYPTPPPTLTHTTHQPPSGSPHHTQPSPHANPLNCHPHRPSSLPRCPLFHTVLHRIMTLPSPNTPTPPPLRPPIPHTTPVLTAVLFILFLMWGLIIGNCCKKKKRKKDSMHQKTKVKRKSWKERNFVPVDALNILFIY